MALGREKSLQIREKGIYNFGMTMKTTVSVVAFLLLFGEAVVDPLLEVQELIGDAFSYRLHSPVQERLLVLSLVTAE